ncbi:MAG TPA: VCBS repeat-containing protein [Burkholderiales bacterium]|nr:VCBS repeat-containing protein [Burkholderiales bacterium]
MLHFGWVLHALFLVISVGTAFAEDYRADLNKYQYKLEIGKGAKVCEHMARLYNTRFKQPWAFTLSNPPGPSFARLPGVATRADSYERLGILLSRYPRSGEFDAIDWREGEYLWDARRPQSMRPALVAVFDINNDGRPDLVVKASFMNSFYPAGGGAAGGNDQLFILPDRKIDADHPLTGEELYDERLTGKAARIEYDLLGFGARLIRPFIFEGTTYLSVYEQFAMFEPKERRERMWVLKYQSGGHNWGKGKWEPLELAKVCRFRMIAHN